MKRKRDFFAKFRPVKLGPGARVEVRDLYVATACGPGKEPVAPFLDVGGRDEEVAVQKARDGRVGTRGRAHLAGEKTCGAAFLVRIEILKVLATVSGRGPLLVPRRQLMVLRRHPVFHQVVVVGEHGGAVGWGHEPLDLGWRLPNFHTLTCAGVATGCDLVPAARAGGGGRWVRRQAQPLPPAQPADHRGFRVGFRANREARAGD